MTTVAELIDFLKEVDPMNFSDAEYFYRWCIWHLTDNGCMSLCDEGDDERRFMEVSAEVRYMPYLYGYGMVCLRRANQNALSDLFWSDDEPLEFSSTIEDYIPAFVLGQMVAKRHAESGRDKECAIESEISDEHVKFLLSGIDRDLHECIPHLRIALNMPCPVATKTVEEYDEETENSWEKEVDVYTDFDGFFEFVDSCSVDDDNDIRPGVFFGSSLSDPYEHWVHSGMPLWP